MIDADAFEAICVRIESGEPTWPILRELGIAKATWYKWLNDAPDRAVRYGLAKKHRRKEIAARLREIARGKGESTGDVQRDKLIIETDLKLLAKWSPKEWGDKVQTEHSGAVAVISHEEWLSKIGGAND